jgi:hypothetical protein
MNRLVQQLRYSFLKRPVDVFVDAAIGASGAATVGATVKGIISIAKTGTGKYKVVFGTKPNGVSRPDSYVRLLNVQVSTKPAGAATTVATVQVTDDQSADPTKGYVEVTLLDFAGAAVEPASGDHIYLVFQFNDSVAA